MDNDLLKIISVAREKLKETPHSMLFGDLPNGEDKISNNNDIFPAYYEFLKVCNGARCGDIDLWSNNDLPDTQFYIEELDGGRDIWLCIGQILYEPLIFNCMDEKVYFFRKDELDSAPIFIFDSFYDFFKNYVFGQKYKEIIPDVDNDSWYDFLTDNEYFVS